MKENTIGLSVVKIQLIFIPVDPYMHILNIKHTKIHTQNTPPPPHTQKNKKNHQEKPINSCS